MAEEDTKQSEAPAAGSAAAPAERPAENPVIPDYRSPNLLYYADISRLLMRMHRNVEAHMEAHKRLTERLQAVFAHEQAMALELARMIDSSIGQAARQSNAERPAIGSENIQKIFSHASNAIEESGKMLTDIQLEALALLRQYVGDGDSKAKKP
jgi:hypothetical protein